MLIAAVNVAENRRRLAIPLTGCLPAQPATATLLLATGASHPAARSTALQDELLTRCTDLTGIPLPMKKAQ